jgi:hypothetical protein
MGWVVVPCLLEGRDQLNARFPNRDKSSEGTIGDTAHQAEASSHNPDLTGHPEYRDGDSKDEVRAWDADKDLRDPSGIQMETLVQALITRLRAGELWWIRYIIYNRRIWHRRDGFVTRAYTGSNPHTDHVHFNSDFTQAADEATGTNWHFSEIGAATPVSNPPSAPAKSNTVLKIGSKGDEVGHLQEFFKNVFPDYRHYVPVKRNQMISVDKDYGPQTAAWVKEFQKRVNIKQDGEAGPVTKSNMRRFGYKY